MEVIMKSIVLFFLFVFTYNIFLFCQVKTGIDGILTNDNSNFISVNEVKMWLSNNGMGSHNPTTDGSGFYWPGGDEGSLTAVFADGLVWGGIVNSQILVNGNTYRYGLQAGKILENGAPDDPWDSKYRVYKILDGWENLPLGSVRDQYEQDFNEWPMEDGAPYEDVDGNGAYTPGVDGPKYVGDETLWYVANDLDPSRTTFTYGSLPIGLEFQTTTYAFDQANFLADAVFKKYRIINKSSNTIDSMYLVYWMDDDLGDAGDDYSGCDTVLDLGYTYNADNNDVGFYGANPPAVGHLLLQGPVVNATLQDSAYFNNEWHKGYRNLPMTTFAFYINDFTSPYQDPDLGVYDGTLQFYNYMSGKLWNGDPYIDPNTGLETMFPLAGDPVNGTGWYEGGGWPGGPVPGDRRSLVSSGPFTMQPADTQEVVVAIYIAIGSDNLNSVTEMKNKAQSLKDFYFTGTVTALDDNMAEIVRDFKLSQNYPNPFNPSTVISWQSPVGSRQILKIYDLLGREVKTLVNEEKKAGYHSIDFNGSDLPSGIYFYRLQTGDFVQTRKMILLK